VFITLLKYLEAIFKCFIFYSFTYASWNDFCSYFDEEIKICFYFIRLILYNHVFWYNYKYYHLLKINSVFKWNFILAFVNWFLIMFVIMNKSVYFDQVHHLKNKKRIFCFRFYLWINKNFQIKYDIFMINKNIIWSI
jgi:hypothetical protein